MTIQKSDIFQINQYYQAISDLHTHLHQVGRFPHPDQYPVLKAFFQDKKKIIMGQCGRSFGKTEINLYIVWRYALTVPRSLIYIICPEIKQAGKIYWLPKRLQYYGPFKYVDELSKSELRVSFKNGSTIVVDGCENHQSLRGIKPDLVLYDEFQLHSREFDEEVMQPNFASGLVSLIAMGTPPKRHCYYVEFREELLRGIENGDKDKFYVELPTHCNPIQSKVWLEKKKEELVRRGRLNVWLREFMGKMVFDTESAVFPFFDGRQNGKNIRSAAEIEKILSADKRKLNYYAIFDPGTATVFAVLFAAINPYTNQVIIVDEIYAKTKDEMKASSVWEKAKEKMDAICDDESRWIMYYDEAATWFPNEIGQGMVPTRKFKYNLQKLHEEGRPGESIINTLMEKEDGFFVSEVCKNFVWEITNYILDEQGRYPRKDDHLMDCLFYLVLESNLSATPEIDKYDIERMEDFRTVRRPQDVALQMQKRDLSQAVPINYYDFDSTDDIWMQ